ncbi:hypothetical protein BAUCODRAFT_246226 [Baudoinia panamericana UAMH 10762]|uniref:Uncharacterized protein n=1 Tax=Baudoinia panamericana (strain UAMH 10762) TaxID=717646 RepID=M2N3L1_BAUPA|nr:uncharacterized protein BAUCODRAFT_246226 [Baudoinia panamericana UAMH 10762]EMC93589.1 hypothetical protein BAUCODRAFT_246226 [Baudoinia panamericana UAMH 10762]
MLCRSSGRYADSEWTTFSDWEHWNEVVGKLSLSCIDINSPEREWRSKGRGEPSLLWYAVKISVHSESDKLPQIGTRCRMLPQCSLAPKQMSIRLCCYHDEQQRRKPETYQVQLPEPQDYPKPLTNGNGITVGDLFEATLRLRAGHRMCPYESHSCSTINDHGFVAVRVYFEAEVHLSEQSLTSIRHRRRLDEEKQRFEARSLFRSRRRTNSQRKAETREEKYEERRSYAKAKRLAFLKGRPIPTLAEYRFVKDGHDKLANKHSLIAQEDGVYVARQQ